MDSSHPRTPPKPRVHPKVVPIRDVTAADEDLYEIRRKVYPRSVSGGFATLRWAFVWLTQLVFYGGCWLTWNERQAILFDLVGRKFYVFGLVLWPQDVFFLAVLLIIAACALFLFTAVAGRVWCGFACPQTVYTLIFLWIEERVEGDRRKRIKLDAQPASVRKLSIKGTKWLLWFLVSLWTGLTFVGYFTPVRELLAAFVRVELSGWELFWVLFYGGFTYLMAGVMREQVCKYMCPYARFQGVMFDPDTLVIAYDAERGEARGARRKGADAKALGLGDCVDCGICVQVCPTGIDIRNGLQYECIGCAACIDACDQVMDKMAYPRGLIRYSTENAVRQHWGRKDILMHVVRPRTLAYAAALTVLVAAFAWGLAARQPVRMDVLRDRASLAQEGVDGSVENVYVLNLMNVSEQPTEVTVTVSGVEGMALDGASRIALAGGASRSVSVRARTPGGLLPSGSHRIFFELRSSDGNVALREKSTFLIPR